METMTIAVVGRNLPSKKHVAEYLGEHVEALYSPDAETLAETCFLLGKCPRDVGTVTLAMPIADVLGANPWILNAVRLNKPDCIALTDVHEQVDEIRKLETGNGLDQIKGWEYIRGLSEYLQRITGVETRFYGFDTDDGYKVIRRW